MKQTTRRYNKFSGYSLEDCDCRYCLYYGGKRKRRVICLADEQGRNHKSSPPGKEQKWK